MIAATSEAELQALPWISFLTEREWLGEGCAIFCGFLSSAVDVLSRSGLGNSMRLL
jgi:hypothetical protein